MKLRAFLLLLVISLFAVQGQAAICSNTITTRTGKGSSLTFSEMDNNLGDLSGLCSWADTGPIDLAALPLTWQVTNDTGTGSTNKLVAKLSAGKALKATTGDNKSYTLLGVVVSGGATSGSAKIAVSGTATCTFDGSATQGNWVSLSTGTAGDCHDSGSSLPTDGTIVFGIVAATRVGSGDTTIYPFSPQVLSNDYPVQGPISAVDNAIARFDATTGRLVQNSDVTISDLVSTIVSIASSPGNELDLKSTSPTVSSASQAGSGMVISAASATAGSSSAGAPAGGAITLSGGTAAYLTSGNAAGGAIGMTAGTGVNQSGGAGGNGGVITVNGGPGGSNGSAIGGSVTIAAGATNSATTGSSVTINGGSSASAGGSVNLNGGNSSSSGAGGTVTITGGTGAGAGIGGQTSIFGGQGGATNAAGGQLILQGGATTFAGNGAGGAITVQGGGGSGTGAGGNTVINGGTAGSGASGQVQITGGSSSGNVAGGAISIIGGTGGGATGVGGGATIKSGPGVGGSAAGSAIISSNNGTNTLTCNDTNCTPAGTWTLASVTGFVPRQVLDFAGGFASNGNNAVPADVCTAFISANLGSTIRAYGNFINLTMTGYSTIRILCAAKDAAAQSGTTTCLIRNYTDSTDLVTVTTTSTSCSVLTNTAAIALSGTKTLGCQIKNSVSTDDPNFGACTAELIP